MNTWKYSFSHVPPATGKKKKKEKVKKSQDKHPNIEANKLLKIASFRQINVYWSFNFVAIFCLILGLN